MSLVFNGVETNKVMWNGIETTGYFNGNMVWGYTPPSSGLVYSSAFDFTAKAGTTNNILTNQILPTADYDYFTVKFGLAFTANSTIEDDFSILANNQDWNIILCSPIGTSEVPLYWGTPQSPVNLTYTGCTQRTQDSGKKKIMSYKGLTNRTVREYKMLYNNNNNSITMYYDGTPYVTLNNIPNPVSSINKIYHHCWTNWSCTARMSGCEIAGFKNLSDAQSY